MIPRTPTLLTKLPAVGTTIFTVMSTLAAEKGAVNLGQGFPDFDCDPALVDAVAGAMQRGLNQYPPMTGVPLLRDAVAAKLQAWHGPYGGRSYDSASEITITAGATQAIITAILAVVRPGGLMASFSCSGLLQDGAFIGMLFQAARRAGRTMRLLQTLGAGPDHPQRPDFNRSRYLKGALLHVD